MSLCKFKNKDINVLIDLLDACLGGNGSCHGITDEVLKCKLIFDISSKTHDSKDIARSIIWGLPNCYEQEKMKVIPYGKKFINCISSCEVVWRNVFRFFEMGDSRRQELAAVILASTYSKNYGVFMALLCGLSSYQRTIFSKEYTRQDWIKNFKEVNRMCDSIHIEKEWERYDRSLFSVTLALMEVCAHFWEFALDSNYIRTEFREVVNSLVQIADLRCFNKLEICDYLYIYLSFSYLEYSHIHASDRPVPRIILTIWTDKFMRIMTAYLNEDN